MLIEEVDFSRVNHYLNTNVIPVFVQYGHECYEITSSSNNAENAWLIFQKLFYFQFYAGHKEYLDSLFEERFYAKEHFGGKIAFSNTDKTFYNQLITGRDSAAKFAKNAYAFVSVKKSDHLYILKKVIAETNLKDFRLFVTMVEYTNDPNFKKELVDVRKQFARKKKLYRIKKGNLVAGHINSLVLNDQEKLIKYVRNEFKKRSLIGDIVLSEEQEKTLDEYMAYQLQEFNKNPASFKPQYSRVFALGLVRYATKHYNTKGTGDFWPYFKVDYNVPITIRNQKYIHDTFRNIMKCYKMIYSDGVTQKIDNITMHSFVADHSANQLFDYLFDFWRLDLSRNTENLNTTGEGEDSFNALIDSMMNGTQDVMKHTSLLLSFPKTKPIVKNRIKRILRLINDAFWNNVSINETGNRINHLLNIWIDNPKGVFQKERNYLAHSGSKDKGDVLFHSPVFEIDSQNEILKIVLPLQRLINCNEEDRPIWRIECSNPEFKAMVIETNEHYKNDKIGYYVEKLTTDIPLHLMLSEFTFTLISGEKELKKYKIHSSKIRFFVGKGKYIDHKASLIPVGPITAYSDSELYPTVLGETVESMQSDGLVMKSFSSLAKGQIVILEDSSGLQVGQRLEEGFNESYPIQGAKLISEKSECNIYAQLPKLLFEAREDEIGGISLIINGRQNKITDKPLSEFKISQELKISGYLIDLKDYISDEGLYQLAISYPKMHKQTGFEMFAYIKDFNYEFIGAPYIFQEEATIKFARATKIDKATKEGDGTWLSDYSNDSFTFNFVEKDANKPDFCSLIINNRLTLNRNIGETKYQICFEIPALFWKFAEQDEWNAKQPANIPLKEFKSKIKKLFVSGPFNFVNSVITTTDDVDVSEEESEIKFVGGKSGYFEIGKIYDWFRSSRNEVYQELFISLNGQKINLFNVICKSKLNDVNLVGDFDNNLLEGTLDIEGDENYLVSIYHNGEPICEDEQVIEKKFSIETNLETGDYDVFVYEIVESDDDGFDSEVETIPLNRNAKTRKLININNLENQLIVLKGHQDLNKKYIPQRFIKEYKITNLKKTSLSQVQNEAEIYGIWNKSVDCEDIAQLQEFTYYRGKLGTLSPKPMIDVVVVFLDKTKIESMVVLTKDERGEYGSLMIKKLITNVAKERIVSIDEYENYSKIEQRKCQMFDDDQHYYLFEIKEA